MSITKPSSKSRARTSTLTLAAVAAAGTAFTAQAQIGLEGPLAPGRWADTGMDRGTTSVTEIVELYYDVVDPDPSDGVSTRLCQFHTVAERAGTVRIFWDARFRHSSWSREFKLYAFTFGPNGVQFTTLVDAFDPGAPDISPDFQGFVDLQVHEGYQYGFQMGGGHFTFDPNMNGNLVVWTDGSGTAPLEDDASKWVTSTIFDGTTGSRPALGLAYDVRTSAGGVSTRTTDLTALPFRSGSATFDWTFAGDHAYSQAAAQLALIADHEGSESVTPLVNHSTSGGFVHRGRSTIDFESGKEFGLRVGGGNSDALNFIRGNIILSRFEALEIEPCLADMNGDGLRDLGDIIEFVNSFTAPTCP